MLSPYRSLPMTKSKLARGVHPLGQALIRRRDCTPQRRKSVAFVTTRSVLPTCLGREKFAVKPASPFERVGSPDRKSIQDSLAQRRIKCQKVVAVARQRYASWTVSWATHRGNY